MTAIASFLTWILKTIGIAGCALLILWTYEEGLPFAGRLVIPKSVWLIGGYGIADIPVIGQFSVGHVQTYAADQVKLATAQQTAICDNRIEKLASSAELAAAKAQLAEVIRQRDATAQAYTENQRRAAADHQILQVENEKLESILAEDNKIPDGNWSDGDLRWLCDHGSGAPYCRSSAGADQGGH